MNADQFTVRWIGQVEAPVSGNYTFRTNNDDGTRLWVNSQLLIDDWNSHGPTWQQGSIYLNAGQKYDIIMDYLELWNGAQAQLYWEYPNQALQLVPSCRLYPAPTAQYSNPTAIASQSIPALCVFSTYCTDIYWDCNGNGRVVTEVMKDCFGVII